MRGIISRDFRRYDETGAVGEVAGVVARPDTAPPDTSGGRGDTSGQRPVRPMIPANAGMVHGYVWQAVVPTAAA